MAEKDLSLRDAGARIASSGLVDDVIHANERQIANRRGRQREDADDDAERRKPRQQARQRADEDDDHDFADGDTFGGDADEDDADDASSNRPDEDGDESDDGAVDDSEADEEGGEDAGDTSSDREELFTVKAGGKEHKVTKAELIAGYQRGADYHQKTTALAQRGRELTATHQQAATKIVAQMQRADAIMKGVRQALIGDLNSAEMQQLRATNRQEWLYQRELMQERIATVDAFFSQLGQEHDKLAGELQQQQSSNRGATLDQERELLRKAISDWDEGQNGQPAGKHRLGEYLVNAGFPMEEIAAVTDARMLIIADKARRWDEYQKRRTQEPKRKAKTPPRLPRSGQTQIAKKGTGQSARRGEFERAKTHARKTGSMRDAGRAIAQLL